MTKVEEPNPTLGRKLDGTILQSVSKTWQTGDNAKVLATTTTLNGMVKKTTGQYDSYNNVTRQDDYDWGAGSAGPLMRYTVRTFETGSAYLNAHMNSLLRTEHTYTAAGAVASAKTLSYDNYSGSHALVTRSGTVPGWATPGDAVRGNVTLVQAVSERNQRTGLVHGLRRSWKRREND